MSELETVIADDLLGRLKALCGYLPSIEQVDVHTCEDGETEMATIYWGRSDDEFGMLAFDKPQICFNAAEVERKMCTVSINVTELAAAIMRQSQEIG